MGVAVGRAVGACVQRPQRRGQFLASMALEAAYAHWAAVMEGHGMPISPESARSVHAAPRRTPGKPHLYCTTGRAALPAH